MCFFFYSKNKLKDLDLSDKKDLDFGLVLERI